MAMVVLLVIALAVGLALEPALRERARRGPVRTVRERTTGRAVSVGFALVACAAVTISPAPVVGIALATLGVLTIAVAEVVRHSH